MTVILPPEVQDVELEVILTDLPNQIDATDAEEWPDHLPWDIQRGWLAWATDLDSDEQPGWEDYYLAPAGKQDRGAFEAVRLANAGRPERWCYRHRDRPATTGRPWGPMLFPDLPEPRPGEPGVQDPYWPGDTTYIWLCETCAQAATCAQDAWGETYQRLVNEGLPQGTVLHALSGPIW